MLEHWFRSAGDFRQVSQAEDCETLISEGKDQEEFQELRSQSNRLPRFSLPLLWLLSVAFAGLLGVWIGGNQLRNVDKLCTKHVSEYSPIMEDLDLSYKEVQFSGSLMHENIFRRNGSPEVDAAWDSLGINSRHLIVPTDQALKAGMTPAHVQVSEKYGGGFPANVEGLHHLHCLNLVRKALYYNFEYYHSLHEEEFGDDEHMLRFHVSHCLDTIRQQLQCLPDIAVLGQVWYNPASPRAIPDFNTVHRCRDFEAIRRWAKEHQVPTSYSETETGARVMDLLKAPREGDVREEMP